MGEFLGRVGRVHRITGKGDVRVEYPLKDPPSSVRWTLHPACLAKVNDFQPGQTVRVSADGEAVRSLQSGHGEWAPAMMQVLGQAGKVITVYCDGDVRVGFTSGYTWTFNPACLANNDPDIANLSLNDQQSTNSNNSYEELQVIYSSFTLFHTLLTCLNPNTQPGMSLEE